MPVAGGASIANLPVDLQESITLLESLGLAFAVFDQGLKFLYRSESLHNIVSGEAIGQKIDEAFQVADQVIAAYKETLETGKGHQIVGYRSPDERIKTKLNITTLKVQDYLLVLYETMSDSDVSRRQVYRSEERFRKLSDSMSLALIMLDENLRVTYWNSRASELTGRSLEAVLRKSAREVFPTLAPELADQFMEAFEHRRSFSIDRIPYHDFNIRGIFSIRAFFVEDELAILIEDQTQQARSEERVRASEERFRSVSDNMSVAMVLIDTKRRVTYWNKACEATSKGIRVEDAKGKDALSVLPFREETLERLISTASEGGERVRVFPEREGVQGTYDVRSFAVGNEVALLVEDVTLQVRQAAELDRSNHELLDLYHNAPCGYLSVLADGKIVRMNLKMAEWLGFDTHVIVEGENIHHILTEESRVRFEAEFGASGLESPLVNAELEFKRLSEGSFWGLVNAIPIYDAPSHNWYWRWTVIDITEQRAAQRQLEDSRLFNQLFNELGEAVLIANKEGQIIRANQSASRILGIPYESLTTYYIDSDIWKSVLDDGTPVETQNLPAVRALREKRPVTNLELGILRKDGSLAWILESAAPLFDSQGEIAGVIITFPEVTATVAQRQTLKDLNDRLGIERDRANEANRLKSSFLANMSHEIRTPMTAILGFSDILSNELINKVSEQHYTFLKSINVSGKRLLNLINDILDLSKIEAGRLELHNDELDLVIEVEAAVTPLVWIAKQKSLELRIDHVDGKLGVRADRQRFGQVLTNIIGNAVKFTRVGSITVTTKLLDGGIIEIKIVDTGIGISEDFLPHLFEEFRQEHTGVTREFGGTGLGLAISRRLVSLMGGTIAVESQENVGTTFTLTFPGTMLKSSFDASKIIAPAKPAAPPTPIVSLPTNEPQVDKKLVLVVEDNAETQRLLEVYLKQQYKVAQAMNAGEVEQQLQKQIPDVILMDVNLPGKDGLSITQDIRSGVQCPSVPIVALTAFAMTGDRQRCIDAGCNDYLSKPATKREVLDVVSRMLKIKEGEMS